MDAATESMIANLPQKTGRSLEQWVAVVREKGLEKHGEIVSMLKSEFSVTHGYANLIAHAARGGLEKPDGAEAEAAVFAGGRADVRPLYDALCRAIEELGDDVERAPKKAYVAFRRKKQFALAQPTTTRLDVGLNLKGVETGGRLESAEGFNAMCTHRVRVASPEDVDDELRALLRRAYQAAG